MKSHLNVKISGDVQGVFFRYSAKQTAESLNLSGFARNEIDGTVYIEAEGEEDNLKEFIEWCKIGPTMAKIEIVDIKSSEDLKDYDKFMIK